MGTFTVASTHLSFVPGWNRYQLRRLSRDLSAFPGPRMLLGDLNLTAAAARRWSGLRSLVSACTFPAHQPARQLDHLLTDHGTALVPQGPGIGRDLAAQASAANVHLTIDAEESGAEARAD